MLRIAWPFRLAKRCFHELCISWPANKIPETQTSLPPQTAHHVLANMCTEILQVIGEKAERSALLDIAKNKNVSPSLFSAYSRQTMVAIQIPHYF
ncbi:unnamed protein product [Camellia sinensis]